MSTKWILVGLIVYSLLLSQALIAREMPFIGAAVSNFNIDATPYFCTGDSNAASYTGPCEIARFVCRIFIQNVSQQVQVIKTADTQIRHSLEYGALDNRVTGNRSSQNAPPPWNLNYKSIGNQRANTQLLSNSTVTRYLVSSTGQTISNGAQLTAGTTSNWRNQTNISLNPSQGLIVENELTFIANVIYTNGTLMQVTNGANYELVPFLKMYHQCSGKIAVVDSQATNPGFVVASGSMDYLSDATDTPTLLRGGDGGLGGQPTSNTNKIILPTLIPGSDYNLQARGALLNDTTLNVQASCLYDSGQDRYNPRAITRLNTWRATLSCAPSAKVKFSIDNTKGRTSASPAHISSVPIFINGGSAI